MTILASPWRLKDVDVPNRVVMAPMNNNLTDIWGKLTDVFVEFLEKRAMGGCGMIIFPSASVDRQFGRAGQRDLLVDQDDCVPALANGVEKLHSHGTKVVMQLWHAGPRARTRDGHLPVSSSSKSPVSSSPVHVLSIGEIRRIVELFADSAGRAQKAGFDAVEIHAAHGYLLHHFTDAECNRRKDDYGCDLQGRFRILSEIRAAIERRAPDLPAICRISLRRADDLKMIAKHLERAGYDAIDVRTGFSSMPQKNRAEKIPVGYTLGIASEIKAHAGIPVITGGRILAPEEAESAIGKGATDAVVLGRALLADPLWASKAISGLPVITCIYDCNPSCYDAFKEGEPLRCLLYENGGI